MLKELTCTRSATGEQNTIAYIVMDGWVFFCAKRATPCILARGFAEEIVLAIAEAAGLDWKAYIFCEVWTHISHPERIIMRGEYEARVWEVQPYDRPYIQGIAWCPLRKDVYRLFEEMILA